MKSLIVTTLATSIFISAATSLEHRTYPDIKRLSIMEESSYINNIFNNKVKEKMIFKNEVDEILNNNMMTLEKSINSGYIIEVPAQDFNVNVSEDHTLVYNINRLDAFMDNIKHKINDRIRIVKYARENKKTWVNKLYDLEYNGEVIKFEVYDTYSNPNKFIKSPASYENKIIKRDYKEYLWYGICSTNNESEGCAALISLKKSDIVK
jgi:hypothetical protein